MNFLHSFVTSALHTSGWSASSSRRFTPGEGDPCYRLNTRQGVAHNQSACSPKRHKALPLLHFNNVSTHFAYPCVTELRSILSSLPWPANRNICVTAEHARPRGSLECSWCGLYSADSLGLCNSDWLTLWGNLLTYEHYCIQCNTECYTAVGHDTSVHYLFLFLGASVILKKVTIRLAMPACLPLHLSICMKQLGSHWRDFHEI